MTDNKIPDDDESSIDSIINIGTFVKHLTYYLKMGIFINKGTNNEELFEKCIKLHNKYKQIEISSEISETNEISVRKCLKRLNLVLKLDSKNPTLPVNISKKENQLQMIYLRPHPSLISSDLPQMITHAEKHNINIFTDIPLNFILRKSKYQDLLWEYTRALFFISQLIISKCEPDSDPTTKLSIAKQSVFDESAEQLEICIFNISEINNRQNISKLLAMDSFINQKLIKDKLNDLNISEAREEIRNVFKQKNVCQGTQMDKLIDSVAKSLQSVDMSDGNMPFNMVGIAQQVFRDMGDEIQSDPSMFKNSIGAISEIFQETIAADEKGGKEIPHGLVDMFNSIVKFGKTDLNPDGTESDLSEDEINDRIESIMQSTGLSKDEFFDQIKDAQGEISADKLGGLIEKNFSDKKK